MTMPLVYFYAPHEIQQKSIREDPTVWSGFHSNFTAWIAQTYCYLKQAGFPCKIAKTIPEEGILIADRDTLDNDYPFLDRVLLICVQSDKEYHPSAHLHIVYNPLTWEKTQNSLWNPHLIGHWPMPGLIPRDPQRNTLVRNVSYIGTRGQLAEELKSPAWPDSLTNLDCHWLPIWDKLRWHDYTDLDVIVAARSFDDRNYPNKGCIKLINAWHAGVPSILNPELGFLAVRQTELDFMIVSSLEETIEAVSYLKSHPDIYQKMVANGYQRAQEYSQKVILDQWLKFLQNIAFPTYERWSNLSRVYKRRLFIQRYVTFKYYRAIHKISRLVSPQR
jgi:glycosyltransferase involved in cell wall biosynthesis